MRRSLFTDLLILQKYLMYGRDLRGKERIFHKYVLRADIAEVIAVGTADDPFWCADLHQPKCRGWEI